MHELSLAERIIEILEEAAQGQGYARVKMVRLEIGVLSAVEPEALRFCFDVAAKGTMAEGAKLEILETPGQGRCGACDKVVPLAAPYDPCPACGGVDLEVVGGAEMRVKELEVE